MAGLPSRHRSLFLLLGVVLLQVLLLAVQIKRDSQGRLIRVWTVSAVSPVERSGAWGVGKIRDAWRHYFALSDTARQNEQLKRENGELKLEIMQLQGKSAEADRLAALLNFNQKHTRCPWWWRGSSARAPIPTATSSTLTRGSAMVSAR